MIKKGIEGSNFAAGAQSQTVATSAVPEFARVGNRLQAQRRRAVHLKQDLDRHGRTGELGKNFPYKPGTDPRAPWLPFPLRSLSTCPPGSLKPQCNTREFERVGGRARAHTDARTWSICPQ
eukprot:1183301-Prorocentrum_minimum.AAC.3